MKIVLIENCVEHSANFIIYKGDGDLSLQVIIGLCKHKEAAALKIEPPLQNGRADMSAIRRLFFCRRPVDHSIFMKLGAWQIHGERYLHQLPKRVVLPGLPISHTAYRYSFVPPTGAK